MGWVVLTLRKKELTRTHADLQMQDLQIAREKRQLCREKHYEQCVVKNAQSAELRDFKTAYNAERDSIRSQISVLQTDQKQDGVDNSLEIADLQRDLEDAQLDYTDNVNSTKSFYENELAMIEEESNDIETQYDEDKVSIEAEMESVAQEIQALTDAISNEIQKTTIKLS